MSADQARKSVTLAKASSAKSGASRGGGRAADGSKNRASLKKEASVRVQSFGKKKV